MKKNKIVLTLTLLILAFFTSIYYARAETLDLTSNLTVVGTAGSLGPEAPSLPATVGRIIGIALSILGVIFMAYIVYGGYLWMIARGNDEQVTKAKAIIRGSIIGIIIVLGAYAISAFVVSRLIEISQTSGSAAAE
ncbi:MAG: hypothetical protein A2663_02905 [Candidatus Buchananbacteria bacterium RIFCSPHIGHO2_01_FULL_46_12]|uniref:Uncharacterized protein n=2 Tax=Candidatus Buchananiibacteriota TaxID=1817903 RepID=A0A1G1YKM2_9BACT|nr:MAG: hypothetical protein A2663_02905 [Candidatus Buchananbacteria bacterium RIFCSPHIGHO2_01_FULL_46_12]OGY52821.1 MAG: hypothetical protein A3B15_01595 [Candidatus Buchananbacteria bacterium RIFCSPLOWO2_01_FULL_45_31]